MMKQMDKVGCYLTKSYVCQLLVSFNVRPNKLKLENQEDCCLLICDAASFIKLAAATETSPSPCQRVATSSPASSCQLIVVGKMKCEQSHLCHAKPNC